MNPRYIIVANILKPGPDNRNCRVLQLASGNENGDMPIYHAPRRGRASGRYTAEEARSAIRALLGRDEVSGAVMRDRHAADTAVESKGLTG